MCVCVDSTQGLLSEQISSTQYIIIIAVIMPYIRFLQFIHSITEGRQRILKGQRSLTFNKNPAALLKVRYEYGRLKWQLLKQNPEKFHCIVKSGVKGTEEGLVSRTFNRNYDRLKKKTRT